MVRIIEVDRRNEPAEKVKARCKGPLAVYAYDSGDGAITWTVGHIPTGFAAVQWLETEEEAVKIAERLLKVAKKALDLKTKEEVCAQISPAVVAWAKKCQEAKKFIDP